MREIRNGALFLSALVVTAIARPAWGQTFNVPPGTLGVVVGRLGEQSGATITITDDDLSKRRSPGVRGRLNLRAALARALAGTGARAVFYDANLVRVVRAKLALTPLRRPKARVTQPPPPPVEAESDIIVIGSKQSSPLERYPGTVKIVTVDGGWTGRFGSDGVSALTRLLPTVSSTNLGVGREKVFIRGVADSSFAGPTQAATGQYLGDVRLTYNAPDPALNVYDMDRLEVLIGPQAPLYGAGSLGGVIRLVPNSPDTSTFSARGTVVVGMTQGGAPSRQAAAMMNVPVVNKSVGIRAVIWSDLLGGYIDNPQNGRKDVNQSRLLGHRITLRAVDVRGWTIDVAHVAQRVRTDTGQYVLNGSPDLTREETFAQPFRSDYDLAYLTASRAIGSSRLTSTLSGVRHHLSSLSDASALADIPLLNRLHNAISILSNETRLSGGTSQTPWVVGVSTILNRSRVVNSLANPAGDALSVTVVNNNIDTAVFGQITRPITSTLSGTVGARLTYVRTKSYVREIVADGDVPSFRNAARFTRTVGLDWRPGGVMSGYLRHDQGYRPGGLSASPTIVGLASQSYRPDTMDMYELGVRIGDLAKSRLALRAAVFHSLWKEVQADQVDVNGLSFTENVGDGRITGLDLEVQARISTIVLTASAFLNDSRLQRSEPTDAIYKAQSLPNVADAGGRAGIEWSRKVNSQWSLHGYGSMRYVGRSRLGVGSVLNIPQGDFVIADAGMRLSGGGLSLSASIDNLTNTRGNSFAFGNQFTVARRDQRTPPRPRTMRIGVDVTF